MLATPTPNNRRATAYSNIKVIVIYSLIISASLALNTFVQSLLDRFTNRDRLLGQLFYFLLILAIVIVAAYYANLKVSAVL